MKRRISNITFFSSIIIAAVFCAVVIWNMQDLLSKFIGQNSKEIRVFYTEQQKDLIKNEVNRLIKRIHATKGIIEQNTIDGMKEQVKSANNFIQSIYSNHDHNNQEKHIEEMISSFNWNQNSGYFYIVSAKGIVIHHGGNKEYVGSNLLEMRNKYPRLYTFIQKTIDKGEFSGEYDFPRPNGDGTFEPKLGYALYNKPLNIVIGTGIYRKDLDEKIQAEILETIKDERFGYMNYGYFWVFNTDYKTIFHINPNLYKEDLYNLQDNHGKYVLREFVDIALSQGKGYTQYYWTIPGQDKESEKISYLRYLPEWNWIVGSGFYFANFNELIRKEEQISKNVLGQQLKNNAVILLIIFTLVLLTSLFIYKRIRKIETEQEDYVNDLLQYKTVIDQSAIVSITDLGGKILHVNDQMTNITGFTKKELVGNRHTKLGHPDNPKATYDDLWKTITNGEVWRGIIKNLTKEGGYFYQKSTIIPFRDKTGKIIKYIAVSYDVTEVFENKSQLQKYLHSDPLTDLKNRASLLMEIKNSKSADLAIIDIDDFHKINETYGMKVGDEVLKVFTGRLTENLLLKPYDIYRLHSDVFAVFSQQSDKNLFIINVENAVKEITRESICVEAGEIIISTIIGYAHGSDNIMAHADAALQFAKANNISHYTYDPLEIDNSKIYEQNTKVVKMLSKAIEEDRVTPFFQPITGADKDKYECLMRIINEDNSVVSPVEFLDISKQTRYYPDLTRIIVKKSIDRFEKEDADFSINVSAEDILNSSTMDFIYDYAVEKGVMNKLILEIVESESLSSYSSATATLYKFKIAGAKIAIDDFGTGYSNFDYLLKIKADFIKIDGSIIKLINKDERAVDIVQSIVSYAKKLKMKTIAEFISDEALSKKAKELGVDYQQGYYHGKPEQDLKTGK